MLSVVEGGRGLSWVKVHDWTNAHVGGAHLGLIVLMLLGVAVMIVFLRAADRPSSPVAPTQILSMVLATFIMVALLLDSTPAQPVRWGIVFVGALATIVAVECLKSLNSIGFVRLAATISIAALIVWCGTLFYRLASGTFATMQWQFAAAVVGTLASFSLFRVRPARELLARKPRQDDNVREIRKDRAA
jgi:hypothetical protein